MGYKEIISRVGIELGLPEELVDSAYNSYWDFIRDTIKGLPLKENLTQEQFRRLRTNINIPSLGKLHCTYERYLGMKNRFRIIHEIRNKS